VYLLVFHAYINEMHGSRSKIVQVYIYIYIYIYIYTYISLSASLRRMEAEILYFHSFLAAVPDAGMTPRFVP
jgi:hypothetical protein